nr:hypothetical transcript [Hymenolepis microstoma]
MDDAKAAAISKTSQSLTPPLLSTDDTSSSLPHAPQKCVPVDVNYPSVLNRQVWECAIELPSRGAPQATYTHMAKKSINRQLTSNYHNSTLCHIRQLPQYKPNLTFFSTFVSASLTSVNHSSLLFPLSTFCDFDVPPLCEARSQLKG